MPNFYSILCTAITGKLYNGPPSTDVYFPDPLDLMNYTKNDNTSRIRIPLTLIMEKFEQLKEGGKPTLLSLA